MFQFQSTSLLRGTTAPFLPLSGVASRFQSTSLLRGTTPCNRYQYRHLLISIHVPLARDDNRRKAFRLTSADFNPRPSCEGRPCYIRMSRAEGNFNPRPSCEGRRNLNPFWRLTAEFQSTSLLRGTTAERGRHYDRYHISIHVPLARDDQRNLRRHVIHNAISIHVPLARDDASSTG